jgi:hypothetical protein
MNIDVVDLLHESIDRLTEGGRAPAGLVDRAMRRNRQRRINQVTGVATSTAVLSGAAVLLATAVTNGAGQPGTSVLPARTTAYVVNRTERALASAERDNLIEEIRTVGYHASLALTQLVPVTLRGDHATESVKVARLVAPFVPQTVTWSYGDQLRQEGFDGSGRLIFDASSTTVLSPTGRRTGLMHASGVGIDYPARTWWRGTITQGVERDPTPLACKYAYLPPPVGSPVDWTAKVAWPAKIHAALTCGHYRVAGRQPIDGVNAIKLVSLPAPWPAAPSSQTLWVSPSTYLPVRLTWASLVPPRGKDNGRIMYGSRWQWPAKAKLKVAQVLVGDFRWLRPTRANLAALRVTIPPGFRQRAQGGLLVPGTVFTSTPGR